jgi:FkbM family methyltransferase
VNHTSSRDTPDGTAGIPDQPSRPRQAWRRLRWKSHWKLRPEEPFVVDPWWDDLALVLPRSGAAATAYYRTFPSASIAGWMMRLLAPGMTVVDAGAHAGVYSVLAARLVGAAGQVHAVEPQSDFVSVIRENARRNRLGQLKAHQLAFAERDGPLGLRVDQRTLGGMTVDASVEEAMSIDGATLSTFTLREGLAHVDLLKLDAAGDELRVLRGARDQLEAGVVGSVICKLYHPDVTAERFQATTSPTACTDLLSDCGFRVELETGVPATGNDISRLFESGAYTVAALATTLPAMGG